MSARTKTEAAADRVAQAREGRKTRRNAIATAIIGAVALVAGAVVPVVFSRTNPNSPVIVALLPRPTTTVTATSTVTAPAPAASTTPLAAGSVWWKGRITVTEHPTDLDAQPPATAPDGNSGHDGDVEVDGSDDALHLAYRSARWLDEGEPSEQDCVELLDAVGGARTYEDLEAGQRICTETTAGRIALIAIAGPVQRDVNGQHVKADVTVWVNADG